MRREFTVGAAIRAQTICRNEESMEYPAVSELCRVIEADTRTVVVDQVVAERLRRGDDVSPVELQRNSVRIMARRVSEWRVPPLFFGERGDEVELFEWKYAYDPDLLGYMAGVLPMIRLKTTGAVVV